ncbi:CoB--CoM heterodisulfide reductase iron-sulfur subunit B family protein [Chloroflexota bacterium]
MKSYAYYPGCSLESLGKNYHTSTTEVSSVLDLDLQELDDWNCCGATAYFPVDELLAYTLSARNLAIAEQMGLKDFIAPCSACYKNSYSTNKYIKTDPDLAEHINFALEADNLKVSGSLNVRHLIEVFIEDVGLEIIKQKVKKPLKDLKVAPYYGCQMIRPRKGNENIENPSFFEELLSSIGAAPIDFQSKTRCCGGSLIITDRSAALDMVAKLLQDAEENEADVIATTCPMCNVNLEVYQHQVNREFGTNFAIPVVYFTQLLGIALGISARKIGVSKNLISTITQNALMEKS